MPCGVTPSPQASEPETVIALAGLVAAQILERGSQVVMAGDPWQLGPIVHSSIASDHGLAVSLLERLMALPLNSGGGYLLPAALMRLEVLAVRPHCFCCVAESGAAGMCSTCFLLALAALGPHGREGERREATRVLAQLSSPGLDEPGTLEAVARHLPPGLATPELENCVATAGEAAKPAEHPNQERSCPREGGSLPGPRLPGLVLMPRLWRPGRRHQVNKLFRLFRIVKSE